MITRRNKIAPDAKEVQLSISFGPADVRHWFRHLLALTHGRASTEQEALADIKADSWSEQELRHLLEHDPAVFRYFDQPWRSRLSGWLWARLVDEGYLIQSSTAPDRFYISDKGASLYRHGLRVEYFS